MAWRLPVSGCSAEHRPAVSLQQKHVLSNNLFRCKPLRTDTTVIVRHTLVSKPGAPQPSGRAPIARTPSAIATEQDLGTSSANFPDHYLDDATRDVAEPSTESEKFVWEKAWYPVLVERDLDPGRPHAVTLLGRQLVVWRDGRGEWRTFEDVCPHRLAPLSEGRLEPSDGTLMCSYHGWRFNGEGKCTSIPQADDPKAEATACSSSRSAVQSFPTRRRGGMLWVWPDAAPSAYVDSAVSEPPVDPRIESILEEKSMFMRDLPYGHDILLENLLDASHLPVSHHGIVPMLKREEAKPMPHRIVEQRLAGQQAFIHCRNIRPWQPRGAELDTDLTFTAPTHVKYENSRGPGNLSFTILYATPTAPGRSRVFLANPALQNGPTNLRTKLFMLYFKFFIPRWKSHGFANNIFDGDGVFLHMQEHRLRERRGQWAQAYFMPSQADRMVVAMRRWYQNFAAGGPFGGAEGPQTALPSIAELRREHALDRYNQHTRHCKDCSQHVAHLERQRTVAAVAFAALFLGLCAAVGCGTPLLSGTSAVFAGSGLVCAALFRNATSALPQFYFMDYVHAEK